MKVMIPNVYVRELVKSNSPKYVFDLKLEYEISYQTTEQLTTKDKEIIRRHLLKYYHIKVRECHTIVCLFGVRNTCRVVWVSKKVNDPTMSGVALVLMLVRSLLAGRRIWSKHEMHAAA